ncbi:hypothetical protein BDM02DRAFT_3240904 [Thelephora ganbajun]|uniref:Uncharacterized protein n=1 Tax=Thelephora ganbajun TaxID=370292 RepID=A0ACB6ZFB6_THEGA|nr:hypothetical protein BDM02DRAFT_3240904 [Thelephora ganbajun]
MTKHSKNNTASSVFSYAEYKKLDYGTKRQRLGNESMRPFNACSLCLERARTPLACSEGHLFCTECVFMDLVTQSRDIKKQKAKLTALKAEVEEEKKRVVEAARERVLKDFEKTHLGLSAKPTSPTPTPGPIKPSVTDSARGKKRKFEFDITEVERLTREAQEDALLQLEKEQAEALRAKLPDFWLPSLTPTYTSKGLPRSLTEIKLQTTCHGGNPSHKLLKKDLISVRFSYPSTVDLQWHKQSRPIAPVEEPLNPRKAEETEDPICPSCRKQLTNSSRIFSMKPCFHVVCKTCVEELVHPSKQCVVCDHEVKAGVDILELKREGTGFAAGGLAETSKTGVSFQG